MLAIALAVVITVVLVRPDNSENGPANAGSGSSDSEFASANDTGPVAIITEDPTCDAWNTIANGYAGTAKSINWNGREPGVAAKSWTPEQHATYESMGKALTQAADQAVNLTKATPHRVIRVLYEQFIAYSRAFAERIPTYAIEDDDLMSASNGAGGALTNICGAITYRSAQAVAPLISDVPAPTKAAEPDKLNTPTQLLVRRNSVCSEWETRSTEFDVEAAAWNAIDKSIPARDWTPEQREISDSFASVLSAKADETERIGRSSGDPRLEDIAVLGAQYRRGLAASLPNYTAKDLYLALSATNLNRLVFWACKAAS